MPHGGCQGLYPDPEAGCGGGVWQQDSTFGRADDKEDDCCNEISCHLKNGLFEANLEVGGNTECLGTTTCPTFIGDLQGNATSAKGIGGSFDIPHLKKPGWRVRHVIPEGPEAGIYVRGKIQGHNKIYLPEYWEGLVDPETITISLTQIGWSQDLIVESIDWGRVVSIKSGNGTEINCFYEAWAARHLDPLNPDEKLHVEYEGASPDDYPGDKSRFLVGGWDYDRRDPVTGERVQS
jgi:hypothetical protein